jgi:hypothetical protein
MSSNTTTHERRPFVHQLTQTLMERRAKRGLSGRLSALERFPDYSLFSPDAEANSGSELCSVCLARPSCAKVLRTLCACPTTLMTVPDISGCSGISPEETGAAVDTLNKMGFLRRVCAEGLAFYGITADEERLRAISRFEDWCETERQRWESLREILT